MYMHTYICTHTIHIYINAGHYQAGRYELECLEPNYTPTRHSSEISKASFPETKRWKSVACVSKDDWTSSMRDSTQTGRTGLFIVKMLGRETRLVQARGLIKRVPLSLTLYSQLLKTIMNQYGRWTCLVSSIT